MVPLSIILGRFRSYAGPFGGYVGTLLCYLFIKFINLSIDLSFYRSNDLSTYRSIVVPIGVCLSTSNKISLERGPQGEWGPGSARARAKRASIWRPFWRARADPFHPKDLFQRKMCYLFLYLIYFLVFFIFFLYLFDVFARQLSTLN